MGQDALPPPESPNFGFLAAHDPTLLLHAARAERYVFDDPNTALVKLRQLTEIFARGVAAQLGIAFGPEDSFADVERALRDAGQLSPQLHQVMRFVLRSGKEAAHRVDGERREALQCLKLVRQLAIWFHKIVCLDPGFQARPFVPPPVPTGAIAPLWAELKRLRLDQVSQQLGLNTVIRETRAAFADEIDTMEWFDKRMQDAAREAQAAYASEQAALELITENEEAAAVRFARLEASFREHASQAASATRSAKAAIADAATQAASEIEFDEQDTYLLIDQQLRDAGWEADMNHLYLGSQHCTGPIKGRNLGISLWITKDGGLAEYVLFRGLMPIAVVKAKHGIRDVASLIEQSKRCSRGFQLDAIHDSPGGPWGEYKIPFLFATNGCPVLSQNAEESGVWFLDARMETNHPRVLEAWYTPEGLKQLLD